MTRQHYINGRILLRDRGGVRRYASEVSRHLENALVLQPRSATHVWSGRVWEQTTLARTSANGVLLNMAHSGPLRHPRQVNVVHDLLALTDPRGVHPAYAALLRRQLPVYAAAARQLVTVSAHVAEQVADLVDLRLSDITVVPPGIAAVFRQADKQVARSRLGLALDRPVVAALLDPVPRKNSAVVAQLLHELHRDDTRVQVVVAGSQRAPRFAHSRTNAAVDRTGLVDLGSVADIELATMYQAADVFLSLSQAEGFGLPVVEAAVCGAAVVSTPVPSLAEHAPNAAIIVTDAMEAKQAVTGLLRSAQQRDELAKISSETLGDLQWAKSAATLGTIMNEVASA